MLFIHINVFIEYWLDAGDTKMDKTFLCPYVAWSLVEETFMKNKYL